MIQGSRQYAGMVSPELSLRSGGNFWCLSLNYNLNNGALYIETSSDRRSWEIYKVYYSEG